MFENLNLRVPMRGNNLARPQRGIWTERRQGLLRPRQDETQNKKKSPWSILDKTQKLKSLIKFTKMRPKGNKTRPSLAWSRTSYSLDSDPFGLVKVLQFQYCWAFLRQILWPFLVPTSLVTWNNFSLAWVPRLSFKKNSSRRCSSEATRSFWHPWS